MPASWPQRTSACQWNPDFDPTQPLFAGKKWKIPTVSETDGCPLGAHCIAEEGHKILGDPQQLGIATLGSGDRRLLRG